MLALNLAKIRTPQEHFEQVYQPEAVGAEGDVYTIVTPVSLVLDIHKDKDKFHLVGRVKTTLGMSCSRCQGLMVAENLFNPSEGGVSYVDAGYTLSELRQPGGCADPPGALPP